jgi:formylglycine-generating enzyme required for sulfatase activity
LVDVFISYPRAARTKVEPIKAKLEALGLEVFFDIQGIDGGDIFPDVIDKKLRACKAVLSCWSPLYFERRWCVIECRVGLDKNALVPVAIERFAKDAPPADLRYVNFFNLTDWHGDERHEDWQRTLRALSRHVGRELAGAARPPPQRQTPTPAMPSPPRPAPTPPVRMALLVPEMVRIPQGRFMMGSPSSEKGRKGHEGPQHEVRIDYAFELGKYPVTFAEWDAALAEGAKLNSPRTKLNVLRDFGWGRGRRPAINVSWQDAQTYIAFLNDQSGLNGRSDRYRLPSEAEWEYACRAGTTTRWSFGDDEARLGEYAWFWTNAGGETGGAKTHPIGEKQPNPLGLHDMHGNVMQWVQDCWHPTYDGAPINGSAWTTESCAERVLRGGSWLGRADDVRSANRTRMTASDHGNRFGFRIARTA